MTFTTRWGRRVETAPCEPGCECPACDPDACGVRLATGWVWLDDSPDVYQGGAEHAPEDGALT